MKLQFVSQTGSRRLILIYAGWAMDAAPFGALRRPGYDIAVIWDYRSPFINYGVLDGYDEICVVAWSLGVYAAAAWTEPIEKRITCRIAVNGTLKPIDDSEGIPRATFAGTREHLDERALYKFYRRVAGSREAFAKFSECSPHRAVAELVDELDVFLSPALPPTDPDVHFDIALIGRQDAIFPPDNQRSAWKGTPTVELDAPHYIDLQGIIDRYIIDKQRVRERFARGRKSYASEARVQAEVAHRMTTMGARHDVIGAKTREAIEVGCGAGLLTESLHRMLPQDATLELWDITGDAPVAAQGISFMRCDAETAMKHRPSASADLIATASTVQWFNSPARFIRECARVLRPGGVLLLSSFAEGNLHEVADATGVSLPLPSEARWLEMIPDDLETIETLCYSHTLSFASPVDVFRHLKDTGVNSLDRSGSPANTLKAALRRYKCAPDGTYRATYRPIIMLLQKK